MRYRTGRRRPLGAIHGQGGKVAPLKSLLGAEAANVIGQGGGAQHAAANFHVIAAGADGEARQPQSFLRLAGKAAHVVGKAAGAADGSAFQQARDLTTTAQQVFDAFQFGDQLRAGFAYRGGTGLCRNFLFCRFELSFGRYCRFLLRCSLLPGPACHHRQHGEERRTGKNDMAQREQVALLEKARMVEIDLSAHAATGSSRSAAPMARKL